LRVKKGEVFELAIERLGFGGYGIAHLNGLVIFVEKAIPGDVVKARIVRIKKSYVKARLVELVRPSPDRTMAPCPYSEFCGGCKWQFLDYPKELEYKRQHVIESLEHIGKLSDILVHDVLPSDKIFGYRNKMEFSFSDRRWRLPDEMAQERIDDGFALGLHAPGDFSKVIDIKKCLLQPETGNQILEDVRTFVRSSGIPVYSLRTHEGFWRFLMLRYSHVHDIWMVNIITSEEKILWVQPMADMLRERHNNIGSIVNNINTRKAAIAVGEWEILLAGEPTIKDRIGNYEFEISPNSFFQTNTLGAEKLYQKVKEYAGLTGQETVIDLYSGTGTIPIFIAERAKKVIGIEISESAVADARRNCIKNGISNCEFIHGDITKVLSGVNERPEVMIIDPPRAGMHKGVIRQIKDIRPCRIVYVSCNPATLARDLHMLKDSYSLIEVQPVDMFPHTPHIEVVAKIQAL